MTYHKFRVGDQVVTYNYDHAPNARPHFGRVVSCIGLVDPGPLGPLYAVVDTDSYPLGTLYWNEAYITPHPTAYTGLESLVLFDIA